MFFKKSRASGRVEVASRTAFTPQGQLASRDNYMKTIPASTVLVRRPMARAALWLALIFLACSAWAQSQPDDLSLTLTDAVTLALKQNPDVQVANLELARKQQEKAI